MNRRRDLAHNYLDVPKYPRRLDLISYLYPDLPYSGSCPCENRDLYLFHRKCCQWWPISQLHHVLLQLHTFRKLSDCSLPQVTQVLVLFLAFEHDERKLCLVFCCFFQNMWNMLVSRVGKRQAGEDDFSCLSIVHAFRSYCLTYIHDRHLH